ncbi:hypothetical protein RJT34_23177 [Clitoria ternatea]|uniref:Uncharacterized protein n=1 Tax=Clitoria ternatea TaxID=43366 RepID=A0AAN9IGA5_CLITE
MDVKVKKGGSAAHTEVQVQQSENEMGIRKGPWTIDEDTILVNYIAAYGEGHWNSVARSAGIYASQFSDFTILL